MSVLVCFHAHPDDEVFGTGGVMRLAADAGHRVVLVTATDGALGEYPEGILTEGETGFQSRVGVNLSNSWWTSGWRSRAPFEIYLHGGARVEAVARNITLDGNTVGAARRVDRTPFVGEYSVGIGGRVRGLVAEWRAVTRSREYGTGPSGHAYSTLFVSYEVPARGH